MTQKLALQLRNTLHTLFTMNETQCYYVAIRKQYPHLDTDDWELCLYGSTEHSLFLINLATLANALAEIVVSLHASVGTSDAGTTEPDERVCITIH